MERLHALTEEEKQLVLDAPALITLLIGGADGKLDNNEVERANRAITFRSIKGDPLLFDYFDAVEVNFHTRLQEVLQQYSGDTQTRVQALSDELSKLTPILAKLEKIYAQALLKTWKNMAQAIASSSGGVLGYFGISTAEKHLIDLHMITVVE